MGYWEYKEHSRERFSPTLYSALGYAAHSFHHSLEEIEMKVRKIKQHHLVLMKRHIKFKQFLLETAAGGFTARNWRDDNFWGETK